jgi:hypothetical protein
MELFIIATNARIIFLLMACFIVDYIDFLLFYRTPINFVMFEANDRIKKLRAFVANNNMKRIKQATNTRIRVGNAIRLRKARKIIN